MNSDDGITMALIAHDEKKDDLVRLVGAHRDVVADFALIATGTTGGRLADELGLDIDRMASGPLGGDIQIGSRIVEGRVDAVIFLRDPLTAHPHEPDIQALLKVCDVNNVPVATNIATAEILLSAFGRRQSLASTRRDSARAGVDLPPH